MDINIFENLPSMGESNFISLLYDFLSVIPTWLILPLLGALFFALLLGLLKVVLGVL